MTTSRTTAAAAATPNQTSVGALRAALVGTACHLVEIATWTSTNASPTRPICRWNCSGPSWPKGTATDLKRATSANSSPIIASPTKASATEKFVQNP